MLLSSRKVIIVTSSIVFLLLAKHQALADVQTTIHSEVEGDGSSIVSVKNNTNSSSNTSTTTTKGKTDITIVCNGVKKEYHSDNAESVNLNCDDITGAAKNNVTITSDTPTTSITNNPTEDDIKKKMNDEKKKMKEEVKSAKDKIKARQNDLFEQMTQMLRNLFKNFHV